MPDSSRAKPACIRNTRALAVASQTMSLAALPSSANAVTGSSRALARSNDFIPVSCVQEVGRIMRGRSCAGNCNLYARKIDEEMNRTDVFFDEHPVCDAGCAPKE